MATSIISNQQVIKFNVSTMITSLHEHLGLSVEQLGEVLPSPTAKYTVKMAHFFDDYIHDYFLLIEESYCSKDGPSEASWFNCIPPTRAHEVITNYIGKALTSFEGGCSTFKGKSHTSPETALKRLRKEIANATPIETFAQFNRKPLEFTFNLFNEDEQVMKLLSLFNINIPSNNNYQAFISNQLTPCKRVSITIRHPFQMMLVIMLGSIITYLPNTLSSPSVNQRGLCKVCPKIMERLV